jgi:Ser/Thr protein kinase RdoA (MazF antagonist)
MTYRKGLEQQLEAVYGLKDVTYEHLGTPVNDVLAVSARQGRFALKLYHDNRTASAVQWELDLLVHLLERGAPVAKAVPASQSHVEHLILDDKERIASLFEWVSGEKPSPSRDVYMSLGRAAALIHAAADTFTSSLPRENYDAEALIEEQIQRMKLQLIAANRWDEVVTLGERLQRLLDDPRLESGICHMDLTLDNVCFSATGGLIVFDFDSAGTFWRAIEPYGVLRSSKNYFQDWLKGYRSVRPLSEQDEAAVAVFGIVGDLRNVAWKLGVAASSRGKPLLDVSDLPEVVDGWLKWESARIERESLRTRGPEEVRTGALSRQRPAQTLSGLRCRIDVLGGRPGCEKR